MHELGVVFHVIDEIEDLARQNNVEHVNSVTLQIGTVTGIIPSYLTDFWEWARAKTEHFQNTELKIEELKAVTYCQNCKQTYPTMTYGKECPYCHSGNTFLVTGNEYNIKEIEAR